MTFPVVYDANVLYPPTLRHVLLEIAQIGLVQARWTEQILDETFDNILKNNPHLPVDKLARTRQLMCDAVRDCLVVGYEPLIPVLDLPDPDDRHVLAAAIRAQASVIVTRNLHDFPQECLAPWGVEAKHPDQFLLDQFGLDAIGVHRAVQRVADSMRHPPASADDVLDTLDRTGLARTAAALRR